MDKRRGRNRSGVGMEGSPLYGESSCLSSSGIGILFVRLQKMSKNVSIEADLCQVLDDFLAKLSEGDCYLANGILNTNFAEAALILQSSADLYGKKVDMLWDIIIDYQKHIILYDEKNEKNKEDLEKLEERKRKYRRKRKENLEEGQASKLINSFSFGSSDQYVDYLSQTHRVNDNVMNEWEKFSEYPSNLAPRQVYTSSKNSPFLPNNNLYTVDDNEYMGRYEQFHSAFLVQDMFQFEEQNLLRDDHNCIVRMRIDCYLVNDFLHERRIPSDTPAESYAEELNKYIGDFIERQKEAVKDGHISENALRQLCLKECAVSLQPPVPEKPRDKLVVQIEGEHGCTNSTGVGEKEAETAGAEAAAVVSSAEETEGQTAAEKTVDGAVTASQTTETENQTVAEKTVDGAEASAVTLPQTEEAENQTSAEKTIEGAESSAVTVSQTEETPNTTTTSETSTAQPTELPNDSTTSNPSQTLDSERRQSFADSLVDSVIDSKFDEEQDVLSSSPTGQSHDDVRGPDREVQTIITSCPITDGGGEPQGGAEVEGRNKSCSQDSAFFELDTDDIGADEVGENDDGEGRYWVEIPEIPAVLTAPGKDPITIKQFCGGSSIVPMVTRAKTGSLRLKRVYDREEEMAKEKHPPSKKRVTERMLLKLIEGITVKNRSFERFYRMQYRSSENEGDVPIESDGDDDDDDDDQVDSCFGSGLVSSSHTHCDEEERLDLSDVRSPPHLQDHTYTELSFEVQSEEVQCESCVETAEVEEEDDAVTTDHTYAEKTCELVIEDLIAAVEESAVIPQSSGQAEANVSRTNLLDLYRADLGASTSSALATCELLEIDFEQEEISRKAVREWRAFIQPKLRKMENRSDFDIHDYGSKIIEAKEVGELCSFGDMMRGKTRQRYFIASLQLANTGNVEITGGVPGALANDSFRIKVLDKTRYHETLEEYQAPSEETFRERFEHAKAMNPKRKFHSTPMAGGSSEAQPPAKRARGSAGSRKSLHGTMY